MPRLGAACGRAARSLSWSWERGFGDHRRPRDAVPKASPSRRDLRLRVRRHQRWVLREYVALAAAHVGRFRALDFAKRARCRSPAHRPGGIDDALALRPARRADPRRERGVGTMAVQFAKHRGGGFSPRRRAGPREFLRGCSATSDRHEHDDVVVAARASRPRPRRAARARGGPELERAVAGAARRRDDRGIQRRRRSDCRRDRIRRVPNPAAFARLSDDRAAPIDIPLRRRTVLVSADEAHRRLERVISSARHPRPSTRQASSERSPRTSGGRGRGAEPSMYRGGRARGASPPRRPLAATVATLWGPATSTDAAGVQRTPGRCEQLACRSGEHSVGRQRRCAVDCQFDGPASPGAGGRT